MSRFIDLPKMDVVMPPDFRLVCCGDTHIGAHTFHEEGWLRLMDWISKTEGVWWVHLGDIGEGKTIDSKHYNPRTLHPRRLNIKTQLDDYIEMIAPAAPYLLAQVQGNHDRYLSKNFDVIEYVMDKLGRMDAYGHPQTWLRIFDTLCIHMWHGRPNMPKGAKDPIQRRGNQQAWLKRTLEQLAKSCHVQLMGHTHYLLSLEPTWDYGLLNDPEGDNVKAAHYVEPTSFVQTRNGPMPFVPERSRFYGNTGTYRRSGSFDEDFDADYAEEAGYPPSPIGYLMLTVEGGHPVALEEIVP